MLLNNLTIYYDDAQEGLWFQGLHPYLEAASMTPISDATKTNSELSDVLAYDRPDIVLAHNGNPILVVERTIEVPSGHNVGQRFARLAAAAEAGVPSIYFGPYVARKHGGKTEGPRYMNLRLFYALDVVTRITGSAITTINWPVDSDFEVRRDSSKDHHMKEYIRLFFELYVNAGVPRINSAIIESHFQRERLLERQQFITDQVRAPEQYDVPPPSVQIMATDRAVQTYGIPIDDVSAYAELVVYKVGSTYLRSDPYAGMAMLYRYLYVLGEPERRRGMIIHMPSIGTMMWEEATSNRPGRKDIRLFRLVSDGILLRDGYSPTHDL